MISIRKNIDKPDKKNSQLIQVPGGILIRNYCRSFGIALGSNEESQVLGFDVDGQHYIVKRQDFSNRTFSTKSANGDLTLSTGTPRAAYELSYYSEKGGFALFKKVTDESLLNKVSEKLEDLLRSPELEAQLKQISDRLKTRMDLKYKGYED